jgi:hypothetical protein
LPKVYVISRSNHDFSEAEQFGELVFLSEGKMNRFSTNHIARCFEDAMKDCQPDDFILQTGLTVMNMIATAIFASKWKKLNLLIYSQGKYSPRSLVFG